MGWLEKPQEDIESAIEKHLSDLKTRLEKEHGNIHDVEAERKRFERELNLGAQLCKFMDRLRLFCAWDDNARKKNGGRPWRSVVVSREEVEQASVTREHSEYNRPYAAGSSELDQPHPATIYRFSCENIPHQVVWYEDCQTGSTPDGSFSYQLLEVYKGQRLVFLSHCSDLEERFEDYVGDAKSSYMIAFIPGAWVSLLLEKCKRLEIEDKEWAIRDKYHPKRIEEIKRNFLG